MNKVGNETSKKIAMQKWLGMAAVLAMMVGGPVHARKQSEMDSLNTSRPTPDSSVSMPKPQRTQNYDVKAGFVTIKDANGAYLPASQTFQGAGQVKSGQSFKVKFAAMRDSNVSKTTPDLNAHLQVKCGSSIKLDKKIAIGKIDADGYKGFELGAHSVANSEHYPVMCIVSVEALSASSSWKEITPADSRAEGKIEVMNQK